MLFLAWLRFVLTPPFQGPLSKDVNLPAPVGPGS